MNLLIMAAFEMAIPDPPLPGLEAGETLPKRLADALAAKGKEYEPRTHHLLEDGYPRFTNRLILEVSPYLLQHAHNPVNWYPWSDEAFERARAENKLVLMSVGYSTCHWCHVMERESFEDLEIAAYMNSNYISVKVDREERPDVDSIYMDVVNMMTGRGGWPMTVVLTPDREPVFGGTYFPPRDGARGAYRGFLSLLQEIRRVQLEQPQRLQAVAAEIGKRLRFTPAAGRPDDVPGPEAITSTATDLGRSFDSKWGGFGAAPKFPRPSTLELLARHHRRTGKEEALHMVELTLEKMAAGGMHDQVGGGFHRYSVDGQWLVPHFEKMLYDNAQLIVAYLDGYQLTGREEFAAVARKTVEYVMREMTGTGGGFFSATDADSLNEEGHSEEGWFFTWTPAEIRKILGEELAGTVFKYHAVSEGGNFEGRNILTGHVAIEDDAVSHKLELAHEKLYAARAKRPAPLLDDKILASWNGLMISALARASMVLDEPRYAAAAKRSAEFILDSLVVDGRLRRSFTDGIAGHDAFLDDYAFMIAAFLDLFEATFEPRWLKLAKDFQPILDREFADGEGGGYFFTSTTQQALLKRDKPDYDGAEPSGNSVALLNLLRFEQLTGEQKYRKRAEAGFAAFSKMMASHGEAVPKMLSALEFYLDEPLQVVIVTPVGGDPAPLVESFRRVYLPNRVMSIATEGADLDEQAKLFPLVTGKKAIGGKPTAYVCRQRICEKPTTDPDLFEKQLRKVEPLKSP
jgi:uncharacterized protein YyaL (SSP411 family)